MEARIQDVVAGAYTVPTDGPESDGTLEWDSTTLVLAEITAAGRTGLGYTYADKSTAVLVGDKLAPVLLGFDAFATSAASRALKVVLRNLAYPGLAAMALSAVDTALWDLKAKLLDVSLLQLLGPVRDRIPVYGSGGFTSYDERRLCDQLSGWVAQGISCVKMKVGRHPDKDLQRVEVARRAIGEDAELFVDANGAYDRKQALQMAERFADFGVTWFEEPVSSDDLDGLRLLRDRAPARMEITAGEYGTDAFYFRRMLDAQAVDVLQPDGTRCGGITGFLAAAVLCQSMPLPLSAHTAPSLHGPVCCAAIPARHVEYFHDHVRLEHMLFDGALSAEEGELRPSPSRAGLGIEFKRADAEKYRVWG